MVILEQKHRSGSRTGTSSTSSQLSMSSILQVVEQLKTGGVRESTKRIYLSVWRTFNEFFIQLDKKPNTWEDRLLLFAGHLIEQKKQSQTVKSYISAIKCILRFDRVSVNEDRMLLNSLVRACRLQSDTY